MIAATAANFSEMVLESELPVLVDFTAQWCPPCKMMKPVIEELAKKYEGKMRVAVVDTDAFPAVRERSACETDYRLYPA
jgi:thioredoxin 1